LYELIGLLDQDRLDKAVQLAMGTVSLLRQIAPRVRAEFGDRLNRVEEKVRDSAIDDE
jgi:hypothetical protein